MSSNFRHITIEDDGRVLAEAGPGRARRGESSSASGKAGHLPPGTPARLVDAVLDIPDAQPDTRLVVNVPAGDSEIPEQIREHCEHVDTRAAGASCLLNTTQPKR